eukprot:COSAG01_NODE_520_length_16006_cov_6.454077_4_plen_59_part_00
MGVSTNGGVHTKPSMGIASGNNTCIQLSAIQPQARRLPTNRHFRLSTRPERGTTIAFG